jgi:benzodiazapine receptor
MKLQKILVFAGCLALCFLAAALGSAFTYSQIPTWYVTLNKPPFNPPNWIFGPVWTVLYILMAISLYRILLLKAGKRSDTKRRSIHYFTLQLILNTLWSIVFFGLHAPLGAFIVIAALWIAIFMTMQAFSKLDKPAGQLLVPYLLWVSFASLLNLSVVLLN